MKPKDLLVTLLGAGALYVGWTEYLQPKLQAQSAGNGSGSGAGTPTGSGSGAGAGSGTNSTAQTPANQGGSGSGGGTQTPTPTPPVPPPPPPPPPPAPTWPTPANPTSDQQALLQRRYQLASNGGDGTLTVKAAGGESAAMSQADAKGITFTPDQWNWFASAYWLVDQMTPLWVDPNEKITATQYHQRRLAAGLSGVFLPRRVRR